MTMPRAQAITVRLLSARDAELHVGELANVLMDCVDGGASVSFMWPMTRDKAEQFWRHVADGVTAGDRLLFAAEDPASGEIVGTVQVLLRFPENQPHRGEIAKMLVKRSARRRGIGASLMHAAESAARSAGKSVLVLDTASADAERLYERLGWVRVGVVPRFALMPDGAFCDTTFFYKILSER